MKSQDKQFDFIEKQLPLLIIYNEKQAKYTEKYMHFWHIKRS